MLLAMFCVLDSLTPPPLLLSCATSHRTAPQAVVRMLVEGGGKAAEQRRSRAGADLPLGWSTGPDYLLVLRSRHCQTVGMYELREEARSDLLLGNSSLQVYMCWYARILWRDMVYVHVYELCGGVHSVCICTNFVKVYTRCAHMH